MRKLHGLYLVISPVLPFEILISATEKALEGGVDLVQFSAGKTTVDVQTVHVFAELTKEYQTPFLVNNDLILAKAVGADGVHFDAFDITPTEARAVLGSTALVGYTVNTDITKIMRAEQAGADYVSFCSVFHSCVSEKCPVVSLRTIKSARSLTTLPLFAAGGITLDNIQQVTATGVDGVVVTSSLLKADDPKQAAQEFKRNFLVAFN